MRLLVNNLRIAARTAAVVPRTYAIVQTGVRPFSASGRVLAPAAAGAGAAGEQTNLKSSAGSGQGGKKEKEQARKLKEQARKDKDKARKLRDKERATKQREKLKLAKEKDKAKKLKEREKKAADKAKGKKPKAPRTRSVLTPPKAPANSWGIFLQRYIAERKEGLAPGEKLPTATEVAKDAAPAYRSLAPSERQELNEQAQKARDAYPALLEAWKQTLTPQMIREENLIRMNRRKAGKKGRKSVLIKIEGEPKRPASGYMRFNNEVRAQGVDSDILKGETSITEQSKLVAAAWRALSDSERQAYNDQYAEAKVKYDQEKKAFDEKIASESA